MPRRPCPTCGHICDEGRCPLHPRNRGGHRPRRRSRSIYRDPTYQALRLHVLAAADWTCAYCTATASTSDHVIPHSRGGRSTLDNLLAACRHCNTSKGDRTLAEWVASGCAPTTARQLLQTRTTEGLPA